MYFIYLHPYHFKRIFLTKDLWCLCLSPAASMGPLRSSCCVKWLSLEYSGRKDLEVPMTDRVRNSPGWAEVGASRDVEDESCQEKEAKLKAVEGTDSHGEQTHIHPVTKHRRTCTNWLQRSTCTQGFHWTPVYTPRSNSCKWAAVAPWFVPELLPTSCFQTRA